jgi:hypothetical protein
VLRADGTEYWRFQRSAGICGFSPRVWTADLNRDGREELILVNGDGVEALDLVTRERLWRHECPPSVQVAIRAITAGAKSQPPVVEVFAGRTVLGLSGADGRPLWTCAGLPREFNLLIPDEDYAQRLGAADDRFPPSFLGDVRLGAGDTVCLQTEPVDEFVPARDPFVPTMSRDSRFVRLLPWQVNGFGWPADSPAWLALGLLLYLPALIVLPVWSFYKIVWQRRWSLRFWLLLPLTVSLLVIALTAPAPNPAPPMPTLQARILVSLFLLPIAAFPWQLASWLRTGRMRRAAWWLGIAVALSFIVGAALYIVQWRSTAADEYWVFDWRGWLPFTIGLYFATALSVIVSLVEHCLWQPVTQFVRHRRKSKTLTTAGGSE